MDRPVGVSRVVFGSATRACNYIGPLVSSVPSVIKSSSLLIQSLSLLALVGLSPSLWGGPTLGLWLGPLGRRPRLKGTVPVAMFLLTFSFYFTFLFFHVPAYL